MFRDLMNDKIVVHKKDGLITPTLPAAVSRDSITTDFIDGLLIEHGDLVVRSMSNGATETYQVLDPGFYEAFHGIPAHYQMKVRNLKAPEAKAALASINIYVQGDNNRINQGSVDNSVNIQGKQSELSDLVKQLEETILKSNLSVVEAEDAASAIAGIKSQITREQPNKKIIQTLLSFIPQVANVATISAFIMQCIK